MHVVVLSDNVLHPVSLELRDILRARVAPQGPVLATFEQAQERMMASRADMVVIVLSPALEAGLGMLSRLRGKVPGPVLAVGPASDSKLILRALHEGADHYLDELELGVQLGAVLSRLQIREGPAATPTGRLFALLGASGGSGTSTLAVNLATVLAREHQRCLLIDMKPGVGDLAALLDVKPAHNLADLCLNASRMDRAMFESALAAHPSGVHLLAPPLVYEDVRLVTPRGINQTLTLARECFPYAVADLEDCFHEEQMAALRQADVVLLVFRLDFTSLRNTRRVLDHLGQMGISGERVQLASNRYGQAKELPAEEAEEALGVRIAYFIPDDPKTINGANNAGVPAVLKTPSARVAQSIAQMARHLTQPPAKAPVVNGTGSRNGTSWLPSFR